MTNIWKKLKKPILAVAPMEDVTDTVFRRVIIRCGRPDVVYTEFTNCDGLQSNGRAIVSQRLVYSKEEHPIIAQIWGLKPENYYKTARELVAMGFDGIDINMGCPEKSVVKMGACIALIDNRQLAKEIIAATREGIDSTGKRIPLSVKTRPGLNAIETESWIPFLLGQQLDALTIHGRTAKEMSDVPVHWDEIGRAVALRDQMKMETRIIGNGDVNSVDEAMDKVQTYGVDGVMIGRGALHNPWVFEKSQKAHSIAEKLDLLNYHVRLFDETWGDKKPYDVLKKYFKIYASGFAGANRLREQLMNTKSATEVSVILKNISNYGRGRNSKMT